MPSADGRARPGDQIAAVTVAMEPALLGEHDESVRVWLDEGQSRVGR